jgi:CheY-like chemotaxis protein
VVEDIADTRDMMHALLAAHGHRVDVAADGPAGVATILAGPVDAALVDLGLPSLDGLEVARRVRAAPAGRHVLLIALTGYGAPADREAAAACGFDGFLVKPFEPQQFEALLADLLRARRADASAPARP